MGEVVGQMGGRAVARPSELNPNRALQARERQAASKALLEGGKNKGEQKGFGVASGLKAPPDMAAAAAAVVLVGQPDLVASLPACDGCGCPEPAHVQQEGPDGEPEWPCTSCTGCFDYSYLEPV